MILPSQGRIFLKFEAPLIESCLPNTRRKNNTFKSGRNYFTLLTERAIIAYNKETDDSIKNKIYSKYIHYAFNKLAENLIHSFKTYYFGALSYEDVKGSVVHHFIEKIHMYKPYVGKAFSYFTIVGRNFLILNNNANYEKLKSRVELDHLDNELNIAGEYSNNQDRLDVSEFVDMFIIYIKNNKYYIFNKERDIQIVDAIIELFKDRSNIPDFNKKKLYILIREMTDLQTQYITRVVKIVKKIYFELYAMYLHTGKLEF